MAIYYVRKTGSDSTGDGSTGAPWLTISKALATIPSAGGHTINVGDGTYAENSNSSGYFEPSLWAFTAAVTIQSENGVAANVIITGATDGTVNTQYDTAGVKNHIWKQVTFGMRLADSGQKAFRVANGSGISCIGCVFMGASTAYVAGVYLTTSGVAQYVSFVGCAFTQTAASSPGPAISITNGSSGTLDSLSIEDCTVTSTGVGIQFGNVVTNAWIVGGSITTVGSAIVSTSATTTGLTVAGVQIATSGASSYGLTITVSTTLLLCANAVTSVYCACKIAACTGVTITRGTYAGTGAAVAGLWLDSAAGVNATVTLTDVVASCVAGDGLIVTGTSALSVVRGTYTGGSHAVRIGRDGAQDGAAWTLPVSAATISGASISSSAGHALILGGGSARCAVYGCTITGGDYGVVLKDSMAHELRQNTITAGTAAAIYLKGASGCRVTANKLVAAQGYCVQSLYDPVVYCRSGANVIEDNLFVVSGTGGAYNWGNSTHEYGWSVVDSNVYQVGTAYGSVYGTSSITTLTALRSAWAGYSVPTNDANSIASTDGSEWDHLLQYPILPASDLAPVTACGAVVGVEAAAGNVNQTGDAYARLGAPAGASIAADIAALPAAVWAVATSALTVAGSIGKLLVDRWTLLTATRIGYLDNLSGASTITVTSRVNGTAITLQRGDTNTLSITGLGVLTGRTKLYFTVKSSKRDADAASIIQIEEAGGLLYLNGAATTTTNGALVVDDAALGNVTITLKAAAAAVLAPAQYVVWDIEMVTASAVTTVVEGTGNIVGDVTRAVS